MVFQMLPASAQTFSESAQVKRHQIFNKLILAYPGSAAKDTDENSMKKKDRDTCQNLSYMHASSIHVFHHICSEVRSAQVQGYI